MKGLKQFLEFDLDAFLKDKEITFISLKRIIIILMGRYLIAGWNEAECVITKDNTIYNNDDY